MQTRFQRLRNKEARKLVGVVLAGKMAGVVVLLGAMKGWDWYLNTAAGAQADTVVHKANDFVSPINTVWVLVTAFLVFFMQAGFMGLEVGFARSPGPEQEVAPDPVRESDQGPSTYRSADRGRYRSIPVSTSTRSYV